MTKKFFTFLMLLLAVQFAVAQVPSGYYRSTKGASGRSLKTAMYKVISSHKDIGYDKLWSAFRETDRRPDGKVWDMYSNTTNFVFGKDQDHGSHSAEGQTYNREHSFPKSWFNDERPMHNDLFHLYPTDSYVNGIRSNFPFGETEHPSRVSHNGFSKLGDCSLPGYSGKVFEPDDQYKGDFARSYFYMATAYENKIGGWKSPMLAHNSYPAYTKWAIDMLLRWAKEDPVSEKEIKRNNAVYEIQRNRNPYIDFPGLEQYVWGDKTSVAFDPDNYQNGGEVEPNPGEKEVAAPTFSLASGPVQMNTEVVITSATPGATLHYSVNGASEMTGNSPLKYTITADVTIEAYAQLGDKTSATTRASYTVTRQPEIGDGVFVRVENTLDLTTGSRYLIVCEGENVAMSEKQSDVRGYAGVSVVDGAIKTEVSAPKHPYAFVLGGSEGAYTFFDAATNTYLAINSNKNKLYGVTDCNGDDAKWKINIAAGLCEIISVKYNERSIQYNSGSPRFATYTSRQQPVSLFKETISSGIVCPEVKPDGTVNVCTLDGRVVRRNVSLKTAVQGLPHGMYVVGGLKVLVR